MTISSNIEGRAEFPGPFARSKNHSILQPMEKKRNSNVPFTGSRLSATGIIDFGSQSSNIIAQNLVQANLVSQNQSLQLKQNPEDVSFPYGLAIGLASYKMPEYKYS